MSQPVLLRHTHIYVFLIKNCVCYKGHRIPRFINFCFINNVVPSFMYVGDNSNVLDTLKLQKQDKYGLQSSY